MKIIHCFRSPVGGVFRHVRDLLDQQTALGHEVGFICDSTTGGTYENELFENIKDKLELGLHRIPMARSISPVDILALYRTTKLLKELQPDIVHTHSAKGGVYGRLAARLAKGSHKLPIKTFYTPHGGAMHYDSASLKGKIFFSVEKWLEKFTDSLIFISGYEQSAYHEKVGTPKCREVIVYNGLRQEEFEPVEHDNNLVDFLFIGMMRDLKGPDLFLDAFKIANERSEDELTALFVGDGEDKEKYIQIIKQYGLENRIIIKDAMPARQAFSSSDIIVVPSRAESLPYLVLEAVAAQKPIICTDVGSIYEIFDNHRERLVEPNNVEKLAQAMLSMRANRNRKQEAKAMAEMIKDRFSVETMSNSIEVTYRG